MLTQNVTQVTDATFEDEVLNADRPVVVDFWAAWCGPCRMMSPILEEIASERDDIRIVGLDADANQQTVARYGVLSMPTFMVFRAGQPVATFIGARPRRRFERDLAAALG